MILFCLISSLFSLVNLYVIIISYCFLKAYYYKNHKLINKSRNSESRSRHVKYEIVLKVRD